MTIVRAFAAILLAGLAVPASAATYLMSYSGVVQSGVDENGLFGSQGISVIGQPYTADFVLNFPVSGENLSSSVIPSRRRSERLPPGHSAARLPSTAIRFR